MKEEERDYRKIQRRFGGTYWYDPDDNTICKIIGGSKLRPVFVDAVVVASPRLPRPGSTTVYHVDYLTDECEEVTDR